MIDKKGIDKVAVIIMIVAVVLLGVFMYGYSGKFTSSISYAYQDSLFNTDEIIDININIDEDDFQDLLDNATSEEYYECDVTVNGTDYKSVGIRAKGNTSLSMVASSDSDRYSFKINFDEYVDGQSCEGLNKLVLNNNYSDATMMKEAIVYDMFNYLGADAPLYNYAKISVNGEYWGVYLALEPVEEEFLMRNYGTTYGYLYKPDSMEMGGGRGNMKGFDLDSFKEKAGLVAKDSESDSSDTKSGDSATTSDASNNQENSFPGNFDPSQMGDFDPSQMVDFDPSQMGDFDSSNMPNMPEGNGQAPPEASDQSGDNADSDSTSSNQGNSAGKASGFAEKMGGFGSGSSNLNYIDDSLDSYSTIWDGDVFSNTTDTDHTRVVKALKNISESNSDINILDEYMDVDNLLKYMAVHTFAVNLDSLTGSMAHNYYLYEEDGKLNMIPWDYNLSFGGFQTGDSSSMINFPIDTPFSSGISEEDREFFYALLNNEECLAKYHEYLEILCEEYVNGGVFEETYNRITSQIDELVKEDPTSFYTFEEYSEAKEMLPKVISLRAESILGQVYGTIPSTWDGQNADSSSLVNCSDITLSVMGSQMGGGGGGGQPERPSQGNTEQGEGTAQGESSQGGDAPATGEMPDNSQNTTPPDGANGQAPQGSDNQGGSQGGGTAPTGERPDMPNGSQNMTPPGGNGGQSPQGGMGQGGSQGGGTPPAKPGSSV